MENPDQGGRFNHLGVEVESSKTVHSEVARPAEAGMFTEQLGVYTVLASSENCGATPARRGSRC